MENFKNNIYTEELNNVLQYMTDIISKEYPSGSYTVNHMLLSMIETESSHASMMLKSIIGSDGMNNLRNDCINFLNSDTNGEIPNPNYFDKIYIEYDLAKILTGSENEKDKLKSPKIGTEHVLLSILSYFTKNNQNGKIPDIVNGYGVGYDTIFDRCASVNDKMGEVSDSDNKIKKHRHKKEDDLGDFKSFFKNKSLNRQPTIFLQPAIESMMNDDHEENNIDKFIINLNQLSKDGKIDTLVGRSEETMKMFKVMARRNKNNVILVGDNGVGKSAIVRNISNLINNGDVPFFLENKILYELDFVALVSGTIYRGMLEERVQKITEELKKRKNAILFIDDIHNTIGGKSKNGNEDISSAINGLLSENDIQILATSDFKGYHETIEGKNSLARKFQKIVVNPSQISEAVKILNVNKHYYEEKHKVRYSDEIIEKIVSCADRYVSDKKLPDSAFDIMDLVGSSIEIKFNQSNELKLLKKKLKACENDKELFLNSGEFEKVDKIQNEINLYRKDIVEKERSNENTYTDVVINDVLSIVSEYTGIPVKKLSSSEKKSIANIESALKQFVIGQDEAISIISRAIKRNKMGFGNKNKPLLTALLIGKSGVGKTLIAKKLAEEVYGDKNALIKIDMSEYSEKSSVSKLHGASPGYVGYESGGQLTEAVKNKPYCVLLFDEIEKADKDVYNVFLQLFDEGRLTDNTGKIVDFKNTMILMTSNVGAKRVSEMGNGIGFNTDKTKTREGIFNSEVKKHFSPEFLNRIDNIVYFKDLNDEDLKSIVKLEMGNVRMNINENGYDISYSEDAIDYLHKLCVEEKEYGARPIRRIIQKNIEDKITDILIEKDIEENHVFNISVVDGEISIL